MALSFDDLVITPSGRLALVVRAIEEGYRFELEYVDARTILESRVVVLADLLKKVHKGQPLPSPARIQ